MKDSNAAPSSSNTSAPNAARGKTAAPKVSAVAKGKNSGAKKPTATAVVTTPTDAAQIEAQAYAKTASVSEVAAADKAPVAKALQTKASNSESSEAEMPPSAQSPSALTPRVVASKTAVPSAKAGSVAPDSTATTDALAATANRDPKVAARKSVVATGVAPEKAPAVASKRALPIRPLYVFAALTALILTTAGGVAVGSYNHWSNSQVIAPKVRVAGEPIGGMTRAQAIAHLKQRFAKLAFTLQTDDKNIVLGLADVGGHPSVGPTVDKAFAIGRSGNVVDNFTRVFGAEVKPRAFSLPIEWNRGALTSRLQIVNDQYARPAVDARLVTVSGGAPRVTGEERGRALDVSATADAIQKSYYLGLSQVAAVTSAVEPKVTALDLDGRDVKLGEYPTDYNGGIAGRTTNIHVACRAIDGTVLMPGEVFSFNGLTGERTYKKGYRMAHIFLREKGQSESSIVDGLAGGVCQVSSTLYNAVRKTNAQFVGKPLGIVERSSHSLPVTYVPSGRDATVAWPNKDFKFRNDNNFPVYVRTKAGNGRLTISLWGRVPRNQAVPVSLEN